MMNRFIIFTLLFAIAYPAFSDPKYRHSHSYKYRHHHRHYQREQVQFSATDEQVEDLNRRLNTEGGRIPSLYFDDRTSPYDPVSVFNVGYCSTYADPNCYRNAIEFGIGF